MSLLVYSHEYRSISGHVYSKSFSIFAKQKLYEGPQTNLIGYLDYSDSISPRSHSCEFRMAYLNDKARRRCKSTLNVSHCEVALVISLMCFQLTSPNKAFGRLRFQVSEIGCRFVIQATAGIPCNHLFFLISKVTGTALPTKPDITTVIVKRLYFRMGKSKVHCQTVFHFILHVLE